MSLRGKAERTLGASIYLHDIRLDLGREGEGKNKPTAHNIKSRLLACSLELSYNCYLKGFALWEGTSKS